MLVFRPVVKENLLVHGNVHLVMSSILFTFLLSAVGRAFTTEKAYVVFITLKSSRFIFYISKTSSMK